MTPAERLLIESIPQAMAKTERVCSSVNVGTTRTGINMDAVKLMGEIVLETAKATKDQDSLGCAKLVVFCNAPDDNPFMAGAFHGVTEADTIINVGVSGPGVVKTALEQVRGKDFETLCEMIKRTAFKVLSLVSWICLWLLLLQLVTVLLRSLRRLVWSMQVHRAQQQRLLC